MCTLIVAVAPDAERALVVAANRDEALGRPAEGPAPRRFGAARAFAPLDLEAGGTWMGLSEGGLFVALTNRFGRPRVPGRRSRGRLVTEALTHPTAAEAAGWARDLDAARENGFHLVAADRRSAHLVWTDGERLHHRDLEPGRVHVVTERGLGAAPSDRQRRLEARFAAPIDPARLTPEALAEVLRSHAGGPFEGVCVHVPERSYGTRSAAILELFFDPARPPTWLRANGPPCQAPFEPERVRFE
jgi:uncharacterized protein with NRDE domain